MNQPEIIAVASDIHPAAYPVLEAGGFQPVKVDRSLAGEELAERIHDLGATGIALRSNPELDADFFAANPQVYQIGNFCVQGKVDSDAADRAGVTRFNSPKGNARAVGGYVKTQASNLARGFVFQHQAMSEGYWDKPPTEDVFDPEGEVLGIIGMGNVGPVVAERADASGLKVVYSDLRDDVDCEYATRLDSNEDVLEVSRFVTVHLPLNDATRGLIDARAFDIMRSDAFIINAGRGPLVDILAYLQAIRGRQIAGGAFDVHDEDKRKEPAKRGDPFESILVGLPRTILTSHSAGTTVNAAQGIAQEVASKMVKFGRDGNTDGALNVANHDLQPLARGESRILYYHTNEPGAGADASDILREAGVNIASEVIAQADDRDIPGRLAVARFEVKHGGVPDAVIERMSTLQLARRVLVRRG
jgi:D-3-phosphoglycerate dehydrogenase